MAEPSPTSAEMSAPRPSGTRVLLADGVDEVDFQLGHRHARTAVGASVASHIAMVVVAVLVLRFAPRPQIIEILPDQLPDSIVWLAEPGPGGGGGGGGNRSPDPPRKAELPGKDKITVPVEKKPDLEAPKPPEEPTPPPVEELNIPAKTLASAETALPGAIETPNVAAESTSQGSGTGGGAGTGSGTGVGSGQGSGLGPGFGGGTGGGAYRPGAGITLPRVLREVKPQYTADAMRAKVQGTVLLECIVGTDGSVGEARVVRSLDAVFGLDQEAVKAARQWRFAPGMRQGQPVPVIVTIELTFTLR
jgi:protein TonB